MGDSTYRLADHSPAQPFRRMGIRRPRNPSGERFYTTCRDSNRAQPAGAQGSQLWVAPVRLGNSVAIPIITFLPDNSSYHIGLSRPSPALSTPTKVTRQRVLPVGRSVLMTLLSRLRNSLLPSDLIGVAKGLGSSKTVRTGHASMGSNMVSDSCTLDDLHRLKPRPSPNTLLKPCHVPLHPVQPKLRTLPSCPARHPQSFPHTSPAEANDAPVRRSWISGLLLRRPPAEYVS
ncbi:hypothetical protein CSOJ01_08050 [Colletotrichum sojae]|uniref:Uncharacterized protein n=1 Tax=Colletotrichum sojae TaxID=2175907 RepID=A0A8H6J6U7_9PEZI|nr:hypothetical protein CSOJ01_08050 [Colletotrichum sojae]